MSFHTISVKHYKKTGTGGSIVWDSTDSGLVQEVIAAEVNQAIGPTADSFSINFSNYDTTKDLFNNIKVDDRVLIMMSIDGVVSTIMDGMINRISQENNVDNNTIKLVGLNRFEKLLNAAVPTATERQTKTATDWIIYILNKVNDWNKYTDRKIGPIGAGGKITTASWVAYGNSVTTNKIVHSKNYTPAFQLIEDLSKPDVNGEGKEYWYYLDESNNFVFKEKSSTANTETPISYPSNIDKMTTEKGMFEVVNFVIQNCGPNLYDKFAILIMDYDHTSVSEYGWKVKNILDTSIRDTQLANERNYAASYSPFKADANFPTAYPAGGYVAGNWYEVNDDYTLTTTNLTASTDAQLNTKFCKYIRALCKKELRGKIDKVMDATYKTKLDVHEDNLYQLAYVYNIYNNYNGWIGTGTYPLNMRVFSFGYSFSAKKGWEVTMDVNEDPLGQKSVLG